MKTARNKPAKWPLLDSANLPLLLQGPAGLRWLWRTVYGHGFWVGFGVAVFMTPIFMQALSTALSHHVPSWDEHFKSFIIGDPLLAIAIGIVAILVQKPTGINYMPSKDYWNHWLIAGFGASALYIGNDVQKGKLELWDLLQPNLFYHHIVLFIVFTSLLGGMAYIQYRRHAKDILWVPFLLAITGYFALVVYDTLYPPAWF